MDASNTYYEDFSNYNEISNNNFCKVDVSIRNEGDFNIIKNNKIDVKSRIAINQPDSMRAKIMNKPTMGSIITNNNRINCSID